MYGTSIEIYYRPKGGYPIKTSVYQESGKGRGVNHIKEVIAICFFLFVNGLTISFVLQNLTRPPSKLIYMGISGY